MAGLVLLSGAGGWLGRRLLRALVRGLPDVPELAEPEPGLRIRALALDADEARAIRAIAPDCDVRCGDLRADATAAGLCADAAGALLFHCAGVIHPRRVREFREVNVLASRRLLEAAEGAGLRRCVVVSSNSPVGVARDPATVFDEQTPCRPYLGYGRSKRELEELAAEVQARDRMQTVCVRAPWFYGPGQPPRQTRMFAMIRAGRFPLVGGGGQRRSMAYVDNLCQGLLLAARVPAAAGRTFWIADRRPYTMQEVVETVARLLADEFGLEVSPRRLRLPGLVADLAEWADRGLQTLGLYQQELHVLGETNKTIACSIARARAELGYRPAIELEEGMRRSIRWCLEQGTAL